MNVVNRNTAGVDTTKLAEPTLGTRPITGERYYAKEFMEREWDRLWTRVWQIAGLEAEIPNPGDYLTYEIGHESILCARGDDGKIRAFYNVCQHRGNLLVHEPRGTVKDFVCAYHGWRFGKDGELKQVPCPEDFPQGNPCGKANLVELPCTVWAGMIWFNMDEDCAPLDDFLGPVKAQIDTYQLQDMKRTHWVTMEGNFNWKCVQDNFNESYHLPYVHPQTVFIMEYSYKHCQFDIYPEGHCRMFMPGCRPALSLKGSQDQILSMMKTELELWDLNPEDFRGSKIHSMREALQKQKRAMGASKGYDFSRFNDDQLTDHYHYTLFPNLSFSLKPDGCIFLRGNPHPTDPEKCLFDMWYFTWFPKTANKYYSHAMSEWVDMDTPVEHLVGKVGEVSAGPAIDQDVAIWDTQQKGLRSRGFRKDYMPYQERRIRFFHEHLDRYLDGTI